MSAERPKIAVLAWGSLIWEDRPEFDEQHEAWSWDGPILKVEFSRISESRQRALTLVIDDDNGAATTVAWCLSKRRRVEDAICDLRRREGTTVENIGCIRLAVGCSTPQSQTISAWASGKKLDVVIWTALKGNFQSKTGKVFSVNAAVEYVRALDACGKAKAAEYVWRAPEFVKTPVRDALQQEPWLSHGSPLA